MLSSGVQVCRIKGNPFENETFRRAILGPGAAALTNELIQELTQHGLTKKNLARMADLGAIYSRPQNTIFIPRATA